MLPSSIELLKHIREEVDFILTAAKGKNQEEIELDPVLSRAVVRGLEIIGEASNKLDPDFKALYPHVEWRKMTDTRHRLIHDYFGVDYEIVWNIISTKLPDLLGSIEDIITENQ